MEAKLYGQNKGGMSINGIIKDYYAYAGENISAGDLVEFINGVASKTEATSENTQLSTVAGTGSRPMAIALDDSRVFIAHWYTDNYLYGLIAKINGTMISIGKDTKLTTQTQSADKILPCLLPNGNVFVAHNKGTSNMYLYGVVCEIDDTTIKPGTDTSIVGSDYGGYAATIFSVSPLPNGNVFIAHMDDDDYYYLKGIVVTISGTTINKGSDIQLISGSKNAQAISTCTLPNGDVFIAHHYGSNSYLYGMVCTISGTSITCGKDTAISTETYSGDIISTKLLPNGNVFIAHSLYPKTYLRGIIVSIEGTGIKAGTDTVISNTESSGRSISTILLETGDVIVQGYNVNSMLVKTDGLSITSIIDMQSSINGFTILLKNNILFYPNEQESRTLYAKLIAIDYENNIFTNNIVFAEYETQVRQVTTGQFDGIAKTSGEGGDDTGHKDIVSIWTKE